MRRTSNINPGILRDQMGNGDAVRVARATMALADALQNQRELLPGEALSAMAAGFILVMEATGLSTYDVITTTKNIMADAEGRRAEFRAVGDYLAKEVLSNERR